MNEAEFEDLLDRHGADLNLWPMPVKHTALTALAHHSDWQRLVSQAQKLKDQLDNYQIESVGLHDLEQQILQRTVYRPSLLDRLLLWLLPERNLWRPAIAACLPILMGLSIGLNVDLDDRLSLDEELSLTGLDPVTLELEE